MPFHRTVASRATLSALLVATAITAGCGLPIETIAQPQALPATIVKPFGPTSPAGQIFTPCIVGSNQPHAVSAVSDLLLGKDRFAVDCAHRVERVTTLRPAGSTPEITADLVVSDDLVSAVLTGTGEYWMRAIGPA